VFGLVNSRWYTGKGPVPCAPVNEHGAGAQASTGRIRKVLVVDDEADVADLAEMLLTAHGFEAVVTYSGAAALDMLASHSDIDAVVSDVMMPGMTGLELAEHIARRHPAVKVVLASGYMAPAMLQNQPLTQLFIAKPYKIDQLIKLLHT